MKFLSIPFTFLLFFSLPAHSEDNVLLHAGLSAGLGYIAESVIHDTVDTDGKRIAYGAAIGSLPGLIKELSDDEFSDKDMAANIAGAIIGSYFANRNNRKLAVSLQKQNDGYMVGFAYTD